MNSFTNNRIVQANFTDVSQNVALSGECKRLILSTTAHCYIRINQDDVSVSNGFLIRINSRNVIDITKATKIAVIRAESSSGKLTIMELF